MLPVLVVVVVGEGVRRGLGGRGGGTLLVLVVGRALLLLLLLAPPPVKDAAAAFAAPAAAAMAAAAVIGQVEEEVGGGGGGEEDTEVEEEEVDSVEADDAWPGEAPPPVADVAAAAGEDEAGREGDVEGSVGPTPFMTLRKRLSVGAEGGASGDEEEEVEVGRGAMLVLPVPILRETRRGLLPTAVWKGCVVWGGREDCECSERGREGGEIRFRGGREKLWLREEQALANKTAEPGHSR